jgi:hypothetical protein
MTRTVSLLLSLFLLLQVSKCSPEIEPIEPSKEVGETGAAVAPAVVVVDDKKADDGDNVDAKLVSMLIKPFSTSPLTHWR